MVRESWASQTQEAIFVHYLNGGYNPNIAQNVHAIAEDLKSGFPKILKTTNRRIETDHKR
jgi:hypothetical protein